MARKTALVRVVASPVVPTGSARGHRLVPRKERVSHRGLFLTRAEMAAVAAATTGDRDRLLVRTLAETGARLGEVLTLTPARLGPGYVVLPIEKRRQYEEKAVYLNPQSSLLHELLRYAVEHGLARDDRYWPITRQQGHTIVTRAAAAAGVYRLKPVKHDGVLVEVRTPAWPHLLRHGAATAMLEDSDDDAVFVATEVGLLGFGTKEGPGSRTGSLSSTGVPAGPTGGSAGATTGKTDTTGNIGAALGSTRSGESGR